MNSAIELVVAICIPLLGSFAVAALTDPPGEWYRSLNKPSWTPPNWIFPVMWTALYGLMGTASWLVYSEGGFSAQSLPLSIYLGQLLLNFCWSPLFFGLKRIDLALVEIVCLWLAILSTIGAFWNVSHLAAGLLVPYICWVSVAASLNLFIFLNNPNPMLPSQGVPGDLSQPLHLAEE